MCWTYSPGQTKREKMDLFAKANSQKDIETNITVRHKFYTNPELNSLKCILNLFFLTTIQTLESPASHKRHWLNAFGASSPFVSSPPFHEWLNPSPSVSRWRFITLTACLSTHRSEWCLLNIAAALLCSALLYSPSVDEKRADILADLSGPSCTYHIRAPMPCKPAPAPTHICKPAHTLAHCFVTLTVNLRFSAIQNEECLLGHLVNNQSYTCTLSWFVRTWRTERGWGEKKKGSVTQKLGHNGGDAYLWRRGKVTPSGRRTCPENWSNLPHMSTVCEGHEDKKAKKLD